MGHDVTGTSGGTRRGEARGALSSLLTRLRHENDDLLETLQHILVLQGKTLKFREIVESAEAYRYLHDLIGDYIEFEDLRIALLDDSQTEFRIAFESAVSIPEEERDKIVDPLGEAHETREASDKRDKRSLLPFTVEEARHVLETDVSILRDPDAEEDPDPDPDGSPVAPTAILAPISLRSEKIGVAIFSLRKPLRHLQDFRLHVVDYLLKELAVFINRRRLADSMHTMAALNRGIIESVSHGLVAVDRQGLVLCFNPAARVYLRRAQTGRHVERVIASGLLPTVRQILEKLEQGAGHEALSVEFTASDGQVFPLTISSTPLYLRSEGAAGWVFVIKDSTHRVEVEHLKQYEALKSHFLLGLIHDMKTPLTGILSGCEIMLEEPGLDPAQLDTLRIVHASAGRLQELATDSLEMSALESVATDDPMEPTDLGATLAPVLDELRLTALRHEIVFESPEEPLILYCRPRRIARVLQNLVGNAIKYSPSGGTIRVRLDRDATSARLSVSDEGIGIKEGEIAAIWGRFHRSSAEGVRQVEGTGLGLSIIKMIVDKHRGRVRVDSEPGKGSTFTILLPIVKTPQRVESL